MRENTPSKVPYAEVRQLSILDKEVALFVTAKYKVYESIGANVQAMTPVKCLLDKTAGTNSYTNPSYIKKWMDRVERQRFLKRAPTDSQLNPKKS